MKLTWITAVIQELIHADGFPRLVWSLGQPDGGSSKSTAVACIHDGCDLYALDAETKHLPMSPPHCIEAILTNVVRAEVVKMTEIYIMRIT